MVEFSEIKDIIMKVYTSSCEDKPEEIKEALFEMYSAEEWEDKFDEYEKILPKKLFETIREKYEKEGVDGVLVSVFAETLLSLRDLLSELQQHDIVRITRDYIPLLRSYKKNEYLEEDEFKELVDLYVDLCRVLGDVEVEHEGRRIKIRDWFKEGGMYKEEIAELRTTIRELQKQLACSEIRKFALSCDDDIHHLREIYTELTIIAYGAVVGVYYYVFSDIKQRELSENFIKFLIVNLLQIEKLWNIKNNRIKKYKYSLGLLKNALSQNLYSLFERMEDVAESIGQSIYSLKNVLISKKRYGPDTFRTLFELNRKIFEDYYAQLEEIVEISEELGKLERLENIELREES